MKQIVKETQVGNLLVQTWELDSPIPFRTGTFRRGKSMTSGPEQNFTRQRAEQSHDTAVGIAAAWLWFERKQKRPSLKRERELAREVEQLRKQCRELENEVSTLRGEKGQLPGHYIRNARRAIIGILLRGDPITDEDLSLIRQGVQLRETLHMARMVISRLQKH